MKKSTPETEAQRLAGVTWALRKLIVAEALLPVVAKSV